MARKNLVYNVDHAVGKHAANHPDDVLLVRFFLNRISSLGQFNSPYQNLPIVPLFDDKLADAIRWFQKLARTNGKPLTIDGRVDPAPKGDGIYTIVILNAVYWRHFPKHKHFVESDPLFPQQLIGPFDLRDPYYA